MLTNLFYIIILILGFPIGILLAKMCKDEIKSWRKRLKIISAVCFFLGLIIVFIDFEYKIPVIVTLFFIIITNLTIVWKSY
ncbi:MAG: hypothetical protein AABX54_03750 [Nanoarchaeota archaeon]